MRTFVCNKVKGNITNMQTNQEVPHSSGRTTQVRFTEQQRLAIQRAATNRGIVGGHILAKYIREAVDRALAEDGVKNI